MAKRKPLEQPDLLVEAREVEAISLECIRCACRVEVPYGGELREDCACPSCGTDMKRQRVTLRLFSALMDDSGSETHVRLRVRLLTRLRERPDQQLSVPRTAIPNR